MCWAGTGAPAQVPWPRDLRQNETSKQREESSFYTLSPTGQKCLWETQKILDSKTDRMKTMLISPTVNARLDREGIRMEMVRCQTFPGSYSEAVSKHSGHGAQGASSSWFPRSGLPLTLSREERCVLSHIHSPLSPTRPVSHPPPSRSLPRPSRWKLSTCPSDPAEYSSGFHLLPSIISKTQWHRTIHIWPSDSSLKLHTIAPKDLHSVKTNCSRGRVVTESHSAPASSYPHTLARISVPWSSSRRHSWNVNLKEGG